MMKLLLKAGIGFGGKMLKTKQEIFNTVVKGLASQEFRLSLAESNDFFNSPKEPLYFNKNGDRCSVGHLIDKEMYDPEIENLNIETACSVKPDQFIFDINDASLCELAEYLQHAHDDASNSEELIENLKNVGATYNLDLPNELLKE